MIDTTKIKWDLSKAEETVFDWLNSNGFVGEVKRQYQTKIKVIIEKKGVSMEIDIPSSLTMDTVSAWLTRLERDYSMTCELYELREHAKNMKSSGEGGIINA